jgi:DNA mismatch endonuclease, patch repair protein
VKRLLFVYFGVVTDTLTKAERSRNMAKIRGKDTGPERQVRSLLHRAGYRFRLHVKALPGKPDIVLPKHGAVVFVHGCFWHRHKGCKGATVPKSHQKFWAEKFARNVANDRRHIGRLRRLGWRVLVVWECQLRHPDRVQARLRRILKTISPQSTQRAQRWRRREDHSWPG